MLATMETHTGPQEDTHTFLTENTYDALGNQLADSRKGLQFCYNFANLPSRVEGMAGSANAGLTLSYGYLSDGTKTSSVAGTGSGAEGLKYRGSFVYELKEGEERLSSIGWSEGRIEYVYGLFPVEDEGGEILEYVEDLLEVADEWFITDHLGNTRAIVNVMSGDSVIEQNEYLPFGMRLANPSCEQNSNRYRFGGLDLALSDFGARFYDPFSARWTTRDPLASKYHSWSPYNYCAGNPVNVVDPDGMVIRVGGNTAFKKKVYAAVNHMDTHGVGTVLEYLDGRNEVYSIVPGIQNSYSSNNRTITWNPDYMKLDETGKIMHSPTVSLAHELGHAEDHAKDHAKYSKDSNTANVSFLNEEEKNVIEGIEQDVARALGEIHPDEVTRSSHGGQFGPNVSSLDPAYQSLLADMFNHPLDKIPNNIFPIVAF